MAESLPYLPSNKNLETLFSKIASATVPGKFTHGFLTTTIGLKGTNDRAFIPMLRALGFLDQSSTPTNTYRQLKNSASAKGALAAAIRSAYAPLFEADEKANALAAEKLKGLVAQVAGTDEAMTSRIVSTFNSLTKLADFSAQPAKSENGEEQDKEKDDDEQEVAKKAAGAKGLRPEFHYNIQIHLPATEDVYLSIFNALRKSFQ
jgi:hypothetical protein